MNEKYSSHFYWNIIIIIIWQKKSEIFVLYINYLVQNVLYAAFKGIVNLFNTEIVIMYNYQNSQGTKC